MKVTFLERAPGVWRLRIERGRDRTGKRLFSYETVRGHKGAAEERRFEILRSNKDGSFAVPDKVTLAQFFEQWVENRQALGRISRGTAENYRIVFNTHVAPVLGGVRLQKVRGVDLQALYTKLATKTDLSLNSVAHVHHILSPAFRGARKMRLISVNPMEEVDAPQVDVPKPKALDDAGIEKLVPALDGKWFRVPALLALTTGARRGEVLGLRRGDVDLTAGKMHVRGQVVQYQDQSVEWKAPKTRNGVRSVSLPTEAVELLRLHVLEMTKRRMELGLGAWTDDAYIFSPDGLSPWSPDRLTRDFGNLCDAIGLPAFTFHGTRHTHATALLRRVGEGGAKAVSQRLGHAKLKTTLEVYQTVFESDDVELAGLAGGLLGGRGTSRGTN